MDGISTAFQSSQLRVFKTFRLALVKKFSLCPKQENHEKENIFALQTITNVAINDLNNELNG